MSLSSLSSLKTLDLRSNPKLKKIPKEIAALRCLETLLLDETAISYPDSSIVSQGTEAIMRFLCQGKFFTFIHFVFRDEGTFHSVRYKGTGRCEVYVFAQILSFLDFEEQAGRKKKEIIFPQFYPSIFYAKTCCKHLIILIVLFGI